MTAALLILVLATTGPALAEVARPTTPPAQEATEALGREAAEQELKEAERAYLAARQGYEKGSKTADDKRRMARAHYEYGYTVMNSPVLQPFVKYPRALRSYRAALKLDPGLKEAQEGIDLIEGIYESLGRPVPQ